MKLGVDRFTRLEKVGSGSFGEVFLGRDNATGGAVAIKVGFVFHLLLKSSVVRTCSVVWNNLTVAPVFGRGCTPASEHLKVLIIFS